jgi:hypothetical protein
MNRFEFPTRPHPTYAGAILGIIIGAAQSPIFHIAYLNPRALNAIIFGTILAWCFK